MRDFKKYNIDVRGKTSGMVKTFCPQCTATRHNKRDRSLRVNVDTGSAHCYHCGWEMHVPDEDQERRKKEAGERMKRNAAPMHFRRPVFDPSKLTLSPQWEEYLVKKRCIAQQTIVDFKLTVQDEKMPQSGRVESCLCFNYFENGLLVNTKFRTLDKKFKMVTGAELIPYNIDAIKTSDVVIITEGEPDALALHTAGFKSVISVPAGANAGLGYFDRFMASHFENKTTIIIAGDMDQAGLLLRQQLLAYFGPERCRVVTFGDQCKDANEHLQRYGVESLRIAIEQAKEVELEEVCTVNDLSGDFRAIFENGIGMGAETGWENLDSICTFELGRLVVLSGIPGSGKSEITDEIALRLNLHHHWKIAYFSPENVPVAYHLCKLADKLVGYRFQSGERFSEVDYDLVKRYLNTNVTHICPEGDATPELILAKSRELVVRKGCKIFVFDPLNCFDHTPKNGQTETQYLAWFLNQLKRFAERYQCLVFLVAHPRKMNRDVYSGKSHRPEMYDINGSADFFNKSDFGLVVDRDDGAGVVRLFVDKVKFKHLGHHGVAVFTYDMLSGRYEPFEANRRTIIQATKDGTLGLPAPVKSKRSNWIEEFQIAEQGELYFEEEN